MLSRNVQLTVFMSRLYLLSISKGILNTPTVLYKAMFLFSWCKRRQIKKIVEEKQHGRNCIKVTK